MHMKTPGTLQSNNNENTYIRTHGETESKKICSLKLNWKRIKTNRIRMKNAQRDIFKNKN